ncbi:uncharacterized protein LOC126803349 [Argentina anserina]|uniref:uncharacterized protein LOC126803349 n=1 Tax=Argentina anserina TaxID=57926 RepID=UPI0021765704|nr:uncharacterized protein LOC126803349 [Potentilla anserina]
MPPLTPTKLSFPLTSPLLHHLRPSSSATMSFSSSSPLSNPKQQESHDQNLSQVLKYHNTTKHHFTRYARGPHGLDWANQPNPFRRYLPAPLLPLLHPTPSSSSYPSPLYSSIFTSLPPPQPLSLSSLSHLLFSSLALSAWKSTSFSTWSLRVNPSSGNLHPTEAYVISPPISDSSAFVAHYAPKEHALELRAEIPPRFADLLPKNSCLVGLTSVFWREAWKYGERAFRYCNHDVGHAVAAVAVAAAELGWDVKILDGLGCGDLEKLMGVGVPEGFEIPARAMKGRMPEIEFEHPDCVMLVFPSGGGNVEVDYEKLSLAISGFSELEWKGKPNVLSKEHICWDLIYKTAEAVKKERDLGAKFSVDEFPSSGSCSEDCYKGFTVREVVRKRRSAVDMDGVTVMERDTFYQILLHCLPSGSGVKQKRQLALPFRALSWDAQVHAALFVHRVKGLPEGLYFLVRNEDHFDELKKSMKSSFKWVKPEGCPEDLPLYELQRTDCQAVAERLSCHQEIASHGCFSLGMVACFEPLLQDKKVWMYPRLFWETGVLGQVLYLEAHAIGISATGIGCYFDDPVHELLGLKGSNFQSLYHFTVGGPVIDKRIMSLPAYPGPGVDA